MQQRETLQERVYKDILMNICDGELPNGSSLPTLDELGKKYDVGENCIRAVIARLKENGFLSTKRGRPARVVYAPQGAGGKNTAPFNVAFGKEKLYPFYEACSILFPSIYTHASLSCSAEQLEQLSRIIPALPCEALSYSDYSEINIRFFKAVLAPVKNNFILYIVQAVMQNTVLPAALGQKGGLIQEEEFRKSSDAMRRICAAALQKDSDAVKAEWTLLFAMTEEMVKKTSAASGASHAKGHKGTGLQYSQDFKYLLISHDLYEKILEGKYPVGSFLPTIAQAQKTYRAAKITIQTSYRVLAELGVIITVHGRGSKVIRLTFEDLLYDNEAFNRQRQEYREAIEFLQIICEDIILHAHNLSHNMLRELLDGELNPARHYSALILCRYLMKNACSPAMDAFYQVLSHRLYWGAYFNGAPGGITTQGKHELCMKIVDALERKETKTAIALTKELLTALYCNAL